MSCNICLSGTHYKRFCNPNQSNISETVAFLEAFGSILSTCELLEAILSDFLAVRAYKMAFSSKK